eukprot:TRINITY_DN6469_c0_g1_i2.p1 TRINITY_DN6469_c0_g1~~TRINITY_DN6469_c0_g1_i2.p1  ORF type:complete len:217 (+),score=2.59 TRINITY_DN6469_c0_g1_i2:133-783(+)
MNRPSTVLEVLCPVVIIACIIALISLGAGNHSQCGLLSNLALAAGLQMLCMGSTLMLGFACCTCFIGSPKVWAAAILWYTLILILVGAGINAALFYFSLTEAPDKCPGRIVHALRGFSGFLTAVYVIIGASLSCSTYSAIQKARRNPHRMGFELATPKDSNAATKADSTERARDKPTNEASSDRDRFALNGFHQVQEGLYVSDDGAQYYTIPTSHV